MTDAGQHADAMPDWDAGPAFLSELRIIRSSRVPAATIHAAYYAMFRAARAVLVLHDGVKVAKTHAGVITRYGFVAGTDEVGRAHARSLNRAAALRLKSDYGTEGRPTFEMAEAVAERAEAFLIYNAGRFGFPAD